MVIPQSSIKRFLKLYQSGRGISNQQLKKLVPDLYTGDIRRPLRQRGTRVAPLAIETILDPSMKLTEALGEGG